MIYGVLHKRNATHLWKMLYFQGLFWVLAAIMTELPSVVCLFFFLHDTAEPITSTHPFQGTGFQEHQW